MKFNSELFKSKAKCFRSSWLFNHYLTYDGENFIEHKLNKKCIWYWESANDFQRAVEDLNADDWRCVEYENTR